MPNGYRVYTQRTGRAAAGLRPPDRSGETDRRAGRAASGGGARAGAMSRGPTAVPRGALLEAHPGARSRAAGDAGGRAAGTSRAPRIRARRWRSRWPRRSATGGRVGEHARSPPSTWRARWWCTRSREACASPGRRAAPPRRLHRRGAPRVGVSLHAGRGCRSAAGESSISAPICRWIRWPRRPGSSRRRAVALSGERSRRSSAPTFPRSPRFPSAASRHPRGHRWARAWSAHAVASAQLRIQDGPRRRSLHLGYRD